MVPHLDCCTEWGKLPQHPHPGRKTVPATNQQEPPVILGIMGVKLSQHKKKIPDNWVAPLSSSSLSGLSVCVSESLLGPRRCPQLPSGRQPRSFRAGRNTEPTSTLLLATKAAGRLRMKRDWC